MRTVIKGLLLLLVCGFLQAQSSTVTYKSGGTIDLSGLTTLKGPTPAVGDDSTNVATTAYIADQVEIKNPVQATTAAVLPFSPSYSNGSSGVGATLTATSFGILVIDTTYTVNVGDRILVINQASALQNGCYTLTTAGTVGADYVLTRCTDSNQTANVVNGDTYLTLNGTKNVNQQFTLILSGAATLGTTALNFTQTSGGSQLTAGSCISITGNSVAGNSNCNIRGIGAGFDGGGVALTSGATSTFYVTIPFTCTISAWNITADTGTVSFDIWKIATGTAIPTISNTIMSGGFLSLASGTAIHSTSLGNFTTLAVTANDILGVNIEAVASATKVSLVLQCNAS